VATANVEIIDTGDMLNELRRLARRRAD